MTKTDFDYEEFKKKCETTEYRQQFFLILLERYKKLKANGFKIHTPPQVLYK